MRTDPPVSLPMPAAASPLAMLAAAPEDEPPGTASASCTLGGVAVIGLSPSPEKANSLMCVLPRQTSPAAGGIGQHPRVALGHPTRSSFEPASVATPALSKGPSS